MSSKPEQATLDRTLDDQLAEIEKLNPRHSEPEMYPGECQSIYYNLLTRHNRFRYSSYDYIAELFETQRCDHHYNLSDRRRDYLKYMGRDSLSGTLRNYYELKECYLYRDVSDRAKDKNFERDKRSLVHALNWPNWLRYNLYDNDTHDDIISRLSLTTIFLTTSLFLSVGAIILFGSVSASNIGRQTLRHRILSVIKNGFRRPKSRRALFCKFIYTVLVYAYSWRSLLNEYEISC